MDYPKPPPLDPDLMERVRENREREERLRDLPVEEKTKELAKINREKKEQKERDQKKQQRNEEHNLRLNIQRLEILEQRGYIQAWDYETGGNKAPHYFITLLNGDEIQLKTVGEVVSFYIGAMSAVAKIYKNTRVIRDMDTQRFIVHYSEEFEDGEVVNQD